MSDKQKKKVVNLSKTQNTKSSSKRNWYKGVEIVGDNPLLHLPPEEFVKRKFEELLIDYQIPPKYRNKKFSNYIPTSESQKEALRICQDYAKTGLEQIKSGKGLFFLGLTGVGKTHLAVATLTEIVRKNIEEFGTFNDYLGNLIYGEIRYNGLNAYYHNCVDFLEAKKTSFSRADDKERKSAVESINRAVKADILILDDLGAEKDTAWTEQELFALIDYRNRNSLCTFITSNETLADLEKCIGSRVVSRIVEMTYGIKIEGKDYRYPE